ncbi:hypothetical protein [Haliangium ochraceum]|uniref:DNA-binding domain-containing protein n=1 Tax=Haliangium ochraceum (strain DSM 14365 / JCM 11303 / SMP-2) TaxID=502025 RepID=D0LXV8_HALO1|nr:hypothetical protein [Haliangium ochraceum]ACY14313.1 hypothetical protein Hoch_1764 [Haliangium ochraceum DSM 14365]
MSAPSRDAELVYAVWQRAVADENLSDAIAEGRVDELAELLSSEELAVARDFAAEPGFRWSMENLRYRAGTMIVRGLKKRMPRTAHLLCGGNDDWLRDLAGEYLMRHRWRDLGHHYNAESLRFAAFIEQRVARRRELGSACCAALSYESARLRVLVAATASMPETPAVTAFEDWRPQRAPWVERLNMPAELADWLLAGDRALSPPTAQPDPAPTVAHYPTTMLVYLPVRDGKVQTERLTDTETKIFDAVDGDASAPALVRALRAEIAPEESERALRNWQRHQVFR